jgi:hypothetical protein
MYKNQRSRQLKEHANQPQNKENTPKLLITNRSTTTQAYYMQATKNLAPLLRIR